jgi:hypothetical protein
MCAYNQMHWVTATDAHPEEVIKAEHVQIAFVVDVKNPKQVL